MSMSGDPQVDRTPTMLLVKILQEVLKDVRILGVLKILWIFVFDNVVKIRRTFRTATAAAKVWPRPFVSRKDWSPGRRDSIGIL